MIEVAAIRAVAMFVWIDVCPNFDAPQTQLADATFEFPSGQIGIL